MNDAITSGSRRWNPFRNERPRHCRGELDVQGAHRWHRKRSPIASYRTPISKRLSTPATSGSFSAPAFVSGISDPSKKARRRFRAPTHSPARLESSGVAASELDLIICGTCTQEMTCPSTACRVAAAVGATPAAAFDLVAACSGFVYSLNVAESLIRSGHHKKVGVVGCDAMSSIIDYCERGTSILFGDAAGAAILVRDDNPARGCIYQHLGADGRDWRSLYIPRPPAGRSAGRNRNDDST